jgi:hypothetical protein
MIADQDGYHEVRVFQVLKESLVRTRALWKDGSSSASSQ